MSAVIASIASADGGSPASRRWRSVSRTHPMSTDSAASTCVEPSTNSVEPPPMSTTRYGGRVPSGAGMPVSYENRTRSRVAPANDSSASSAPVITSGSTPKMSRTPSTKSCRLAASLVALVATTRTAEAPCRSMRPA